MAGPGRFESEFRANSERTPSSEKNPGQFRANSEQASQTLYFLITLCNESPWLTDSRERISPWGETDHAQNSASPGDTYLAYHAAYASPGHFARDASRSACMGIQYSAQRRPRSGNFLKGRSLKGSFDKWAMFRKPQPLQLV